MTNTLRKILTAGLTSLALAGCNTIPEEPLYGNFRGNPVMVTKTQDGLRRSVVIKYADSRGYPTHSLIGIDNDGDGSFDPIILDEVNITTLNEIKSKNLQVIRIPSNYPLYNYANQDSLRAAYDAVLEQNKNKEKQ